MRVRVTLSNILDYGLDVITGNSREALLTRAKWMEDNGYDFWVNIPDKEGGDTDAPTERNAFEHYGPDLPEPEGATHQQLSLNLVYQSLDCSDCNAKAGEPCAPGCPNLDRPND